MNVKVILLSLSFVIFHSSYSQILFCTYRNDNYYGYTCDIFIYNPSGTYNFSRVSGTHLTGRKNEDVRYILRTPDSNTTNVPYIICETFQNVTRLELHSIRLSKLDENAFWGCKMLKFLDLSNNLLTAFPSFSNLIQTNNTYTSESQWENLQNDQIEEIQPESFNSLNSLLTLSLHNNKINKIDLESFESLQKLTYLNLSFNQIEEITPGSFNPLVDIQTLDLSNNQIEQILPKTFSQLVNLKTLDLRNSKIKRLFSQSFEFLGNLTLLYLERNQIGEIPPKAFSSLVSLNDLRFTYNNLSTIHVDSFESLEKLTYLNLQNNHIEELPRNFLSSSIQLPTINLINNKLKVIHTFGILPILTTVYLSNNQIDAFDQNFIDDIGVETLDMSNNLCANSSIYDSTQSRMQMRMKLLKCFENYGNLEVGTTTASTTIVPTTVSTTTELTTTAITLPPGCVEGRLDERVCRLENTNEEFKENFYNLNNEIQDNFKNQSAAIEGLEKKIEELANRPCACN